jgi:galactitol-specific phosphotransferase system IIB component
MLGLANWQIIETIDQSDQFLESAKLFHTIEQENSDEISHIMSNEDIQIRTEKLENLIELIPNKTLKREIYVVRPSS